jgi:tRNA/rRNA methyltransferase
MSFFTYMLECGDGPNYVGHTDDLEARLFAHRAGLVLGYTSRRRPISLAWCETFTTRDEAFDRERQLKGWSRRKKQALIAGDWQTITAAASLRGADQRTLNAHPEALEG